MHLYPVHKRLIFMANCLNNFLGRLFRGYGLAGAMCFAVLNAVSVSVFGQTAGGSAPVKTTNLRALTDSVNRQAAQTLGLLLQSHKKTDSECSLAYALAAYRLSAGTDTLYTAPAEYGAEAKAVDIIERKPVSIADACAALMEADLNEPGPAKAVQSEMLYAALYLFRENGKPLAENRLWQKLSEAARTKTEAGAKALGNEEQLRNQAVSLNRKAAKLLARAYAQALGLQTGGTPLREQLDAAVKRVVESNGFPDDDPENRGRFDRSAPDFCRNLWTACALIQYTEGKKALQPLMQRHAEIWYKGLSAQTGTAAAYGRGLHLAYDDTFEELSLLFKFNALRPEALDQLAAAYVLCRSRWLQKQYNPQTRLCRYGEYGHGLYGPSDEGTRRVLTAGTYARMLRCLSAFAEAHKTERIKLINPEPVFTEVSELVWFRNTGRQMALWLYRKNGICFQMPVTGSFRKAAVSDYLPLPYGFPGLEVPVSTQLPCLVPHLTLPGGSVITTAEGADSISISADGNTLRLVWLNWATPSGALTFPGIKCVTTYTLEKNVLVQQQVLSAVSETVFADKYLYCFPTSLNAANPDRGGFEDDAGNLLTVHFDCDFREELHIKATQNGNTGKGAFAPVPLIAEWAAADLVLNQGQQYKSKLIIGWVPAKTE